MKARTFLSKPIRWLLGGLLALLVGFLAVEPGPGAGQEIRLLSTLRADEILAIDYKSVGCFHRHEYKFHFAGGAAPSVRIWEVRSGALLGGRILTAEEIRGLDLLLRHYRSRPSSGGTTTDTVRLRLSRSTQVLGQEIFEDGSCDATTAWLLREFARTPSSDPRLNAEIEKMRKDVNLEMIGLGELVQRVTPQPKPEHGR